MGQGTGGEARPIFLHGLWRSGSTYVWSRFRAAPGTYGYFEPLNPTLGRLTRARISRGPWRDEVAHNRHPALERPYFAEFEPLVRRRGVRGYNRRFASDRFILGEDESDQALEAYVERLLGVAADEGGRPVLGFVRTALRMGRLRQRFDAFDVHIDRDPLAVWGSYMSFADAGNYNFFTNLFLILERNARHPLLAPMAGRHRLRRGASLAIKPRRYYAPLAAALAPEESYALVFQFWLLSVLHALSVCDLVLDMNLANVPDYARGLEARIKDECDLKVSLADLKSVPARACLATFDRRAAERAALQSIRLSAAPDSFDHAKIRSRLCELAPSKAERLITALGGPLSAAA